MSPQRREFLAAMMGTGALAVAAPRTVFAHAMPAGGVEPARTLVLLRADAAHDDLFAAGVRESWQALGHSAPRELRVDRALLRNPSALRECLEGCRGARLVGLIDDRAHLLFEEMLRDLGASLLVHGSHAGAAAGASRHRFLTVPASAGLGFGLAERVGAGGQACLVRETLLGTPRLDAPAAGLATGGSAAWPTLLGELYAAVAGDAWRALPAVDVLAAAQMPAPVGLATSFIAEL